MFRSLKSDIYEIKIQTQDLNSQNKPYEKRNRLQIFDFTKKYKNKKDYQKLSTLEKEL